MYNEWIDFGFTLWVVLMLFVGLPIVLEWLWLFYKTIIGKENKMNEEYLAETKSYKLYKVIDKDRVYYRVYSKSNNVLVNTFNELKTDHEGNYFVWSLNPDGDYRVDEIFNN
jgi:hypothetical protein|tara:strand:+ start:306 stop:641 length:336 start_codon:yes stop_codon:yes gene_type:complete